MALHEKAFSFIGFFLVGVLLGSLYVVAFSRYQEAHTDLPPPDAGAFTGVVIQLSRSDGSQIADIELVPPYHGRIRAYLRQYPTVAYGDKVTIDGSLQAVPRDRRGYFFKEGIQATLSFPQSIVITAHGQGSKIKAALFRFRDSVEASFRRALSPEQATLMTGLVLGKSGGFSKEFKEKLSVTGTTHLVALSGFNITIIINSLELLLGYFLSRRMTLYIGILSIIAFVVMTGAEASVVRAAIMATIVVMAERTSRIHSVRTAIAVTALVMVLYNPAVLAFDVGFQLSFLALIGIVYLKPLLTRWLHISDAPGVLKWRENLWTTISAQLAVLPILILNFGFVSPLGIITNLLLVSLIPATMLFGVFIFFLSGISSTLALVAVIPAKLLLSYELGIINLCAHLSSLLRLS